MAKKTKINHFLEWVKGFKREKPKRKKEICHKCQGLGIIYTKFVRLDIVDPELPFSNNEHKTCKKCNGTGVL